MRPLTGSRHVLQRKYQTRPFLEKRHVPSEPFHGVSRTPAAGRAALPSGPFVRRLTSPGAPRDSRRPWNRLNVELINAARQMIDPGDGSAIRGAAPAVGPDQSRERRLIRISGSRLPVWSFSPALRLQEVFVAAGKFSFVNWKRTWPITP